MAAASVVGASTCLQRPARQGGQPSADARGQDREQARAYKPLYPERGTNQCSNGRRAHHDSNEHRHGACDGGQGASCACSHTSTSSSLIWTRRAERVSPKNSSFWLRRSMICRRCSCLASSSESLMPSLLSIRTVSPATPTAGPYGALRDGVKATLETTPAAVSSAATISSSATVEETRVVGATRRVGAFVAHPTVGAEVRLIVRTTPELQDRNYRRENRHDDAKVGQRPH